MTRKKNRTHAEIIGLWPSATAFAEAIGVEPENARQMKSRNKIPPYWWLNVLDAARDRDIAISLRELQSGAK